MIVSLFNPPKRKKQLLAASCFPIRPRRKPQRGTVVAVGPGKMLDSGNRGELSVGIGDTVIYGKYGGSDIEVDGKELKILRESDILAKVL